MLIEIKAGKFKRVSRLVKKSVVTVWTEIVCFSMTAKLTPVFSSYRSITSSAIISRTLCFLSTKNCTRSWSVAVTTSAVQFAVHGFIPRLAINATATSAPTESSGRRQPNASAVNVNDRISSYI